ncbi:MAG: hypothetical protein R3B07_17610 [Polyangiaceae bacterium]
MQDWKNGIVKKITGGVRGLLKANKATAIGGTARITSKNTVEVTSSGGKQTLTAKKAIVVAAAPPRFRSPASSSTASRSSVPARPSACRRSRSG